MANAKFYLKDKKSKSETPINLHFFFNYSETDNTGKKKYKFLKYYTGEKINPKFWNSDKQRAKETKAFPEYPEFNTRLKDIEKTIFDIYRTLTNDKTKPTPELLKEKLLLHFNKLSKPTKEPHQTTFIEFINIFINESEKSKTKGTVSVYKTTLQHLQNYILYKGLKTIDFEHINLEFYNSFVDYLSNYLHLSKNSVGKYIKTIKTFLNDATERNYNTNLAYKSKKFKSHNKPTEQIYLTENELTALYNVDLSNNKKLDKVRDLFIIGCYTALRFSDFSRIKKQNLIENGKILKFRTQKTDEVVYIPIHYRVSEIMQKYDNSIPPAISNQKMNEYIKEVGKLAGIDEVVIRTVKKGNLTIEKQFKKYELITTHTARRSGATNLYLNNVKPIDIMQITGHKTETAFMRYIRVSKLENAKKLLNHSFFKRPLKIAE
ncbi:MAG: site-specific integrase [Bacteroidales bacterium]|nr:site-specific integrase [Bacteroidales bacterium]